MSYLTNIKEKYQHLTLINFSPKEKPTYYPTEKPTVFPPQEEPISPSKEKSTNIPPEVPYTPYQTPIEPIQPEVFP